MIKKINGKNSTSNVGHLNAGDDVVASKTDIADVLADTFAAKSSSSNYKTPKKSQNVNLRRIIMNTTITISTRKT